MVPQGQAQHTHSYTGCDLQGIARTQALRGSNNRAKTELFMWQTSGYWYHLDHIGDKHQGNPDQSQRSKTSGASTESGLQQKRAGKATNHLGSWARGKSHLQAVVRNTAPQRTRSSCSRQIEIDSMTARLRKIWCNAETRLPTWCCFVPRVRLGDSERVSACQCSEQTLPNLQ